MLEQVERLLSVYLSYKVATKRVLSWLATYTDSEDGIPSCSDFHSTDEILTAARIVRKTGSHVPSIVLTSLKCAISDRQKFCRLYDDILAVHGEEAPAASFASDLAFVERWEKILQVLQPNKRRRDDYDLSDSDMHELAGSRIHDDSFDETGGNIILDDDELGKWAELSCFAYEMGCFLQQLNHHWQDAAKGNIPVVVAAWLSNVVFHAVHEMAADHVRIAPNAEYLSDLLDEYEGERAGVHLIERDYSTGLLSGRFGDHSAFKYILLYLSDVQEGERSNVHFIRFTDRDQDPLDHLNCLNQDRAMNTLLKDGDHTLDVIVCSIVELLTGDRAAGRIEAGGDDATCEPLLPQVRELVGDDRPQIPIHLVYGLETLLSTFQAFMWPEGDQPCERNLRRETLNFARKLEKEFRELETLMEMVDDKVLSQSITTVRSESKNLKTYIQEQRSDLYHQAPCVPGAHMLAILSLAFDLGASVCVETGCVCATLHLYNALRNLESEALRPVKILDALSQIFQKVLFKGTLPSRNFGACYRAVNEQLQNDRDKWSLSQEGQRVSPTVERMIEREDTFLFQRVHGRHYKQANQLLADFSLDYTGRRLTTCSVHRAANGNHGPGFHVALDNLRAKVVPDSKDDVPMWRLNFFDIHKFCLLFLRIFGEMLIGEQPSEAEKVTDALNWIVRLLEGDCSRDTHEEGTHGDVSAIVEAAKMAFEIAEGNRGLSNFQWEFEEMRQSPQRRRSARTEQLLGFVSDTERRESHRSPTDLS